MDHEGANMGKTSVKSLVQKQPRERDNDMYMDDNIQVDNTDRGEWQSHTGTGRKRGLPIPTKHGNAY